jgi:indole-3-glycerol phosphate synthase
LKQSKEDIASRVTSYAAAGAAAISVLTEPSRFDGSMAHLESAASALAPLRVPAMRKDFVVDPYQVIEARAAGAGGVLIILRMLPRAALEALIEQTLGLQLFALLEAFDERDIELAHSLAQQYGKAAHGDSRVGLLVGVNCRDLVTLKVVPGRLESLASLLPTNVPRVAESGVGSPEDARQVAAVGYEFALVGSALMTAADPRALVRDMLAAGRAARSSLPSTSAGPGGNARSG